MEPRHRGAAAGEPLPAAPSRSSPRRLAGGRRRRAAAPLRPPVRAAQRPALPPPNALVALGNGASPGSARRSRALAEGDDPLLATRGVGAASGWGALMALSTRGRRSGSRGCASARSAFAFLEIGVFSATSPPGYERSAWITAVVRGRRGSSLAAARALGPGAAGRSALRRARLRPVVVIGVRDDLLLRVRQPDALGARVRRHRGRDPLRACSAASSCRRARAPLRVRSSTGGPAIRPARVQRRPRVVPGRGRCSSASPWAGSWAGCARRPSPRGRAPRRLRR